MRSIKERLRRLDIEHDEAREPEELPPERPTHVFCSQCGANTFREESDAIVCVHCLEGPFCNYCWNVHLQAIHPQLASVFQRNRTRGIGEVGPARLPQRFILHKRSLVCILALAVLCALGYVAYLSRGTAASPGVLPPPVTSAALPLKLVSIDSPVRAGATSSLTVATAATAACSIEVRYRSGPSRAGGLGMKSADEGGKVNWQWHVGSHTTPGQWPVTVTCASGGQVARLEALLVVEE